MTPESLLKCESLETDETKMPTKSTETLKAHSSDLVLHFIKLKDL